MSQLKTYIQSLVTEKIPEAFTLKKAELPRKIPTGIQPLDLLIEGFQRGDLTEIYGEGSSGRTTLAISFIAEVTRRAEACALVDVSDSLDPESLLVANVNLDQLLWIRCGKAREASPSSLIDRFNPYLTQSHPIPSSSVVHQSNFSTGRHPRQEVRGLSDAIATLMGNELDSSTLTIGPSPEWSAGVKEKIRVTSLAPIGGEGARRAGEEVHTTADHQIDKSAKGQVKESPERQTMWKRLEQALRVTDLLLNN